MRTTLTRAAVALALGTTLLALVPATPAGAAETSTAPDNARCRNGTWPADAEGQPATFAPGAAAGVYLWHTDRGWHLRVTHPGDDKVVFRGTVTAASPITAVERRTESRDVVVTPGRPTSGSGS